MKIQPACFTVAIAFLVGANPTSAAEPAQMRPLLIQGDWEIAARYNVAEKGIKIEERERDNKEWVRIKRDTILVFRHGQEKPTESFDIKVLCLAEKRAGVIEMNDNNNGLPKTTILYRFEGNRLLLCVGQNIENKPAAFAAKDTKILELMPYQQNRLIQNCRRPEPKPEKIFKEVVPAMPPNPPPVADPKK